MKSSLRCRPRLHLFNVVMLAAMTLALLETKAHSQSLAQTEALTIEGDIASELVENVDRFLLRQIDQSVVEREAAWPVPDKQVDGKVDSISARRELLQKQLGMVDARIRNGAFAVESRLSAVTGKSSALASSDYATAHQVRWPVFPGVDASGMVVLPERANIRFCCVLIPDAAQMPEQLCSMGPNASDLAFQLAHQGGLVIVPSVLSRNREARNGRSKMTDQEFIYRSAFVLGRHMLGYQVSEAMAAIDIFKKENPDTPILVAGWGEGGWVALHTGAVDERVDATCVSGHFGPRERVWSEPIHRNVQGLLSHFGDAQLAAMIAPRHLIVDAVAGPAVEIPGEGGAPGVLAGPLLSDVEREFAIASRLAGKSNHGDRLHLVVPDSATTNGEPSAKSISLCLDLLSVKKRTENSKIQVADRAIEQLGPAKQRQRETLDKWDRFQQRILESAAVERQPFWDKLKGVAASNYVAAIQPARDVFRKETIGDWERELSPLKPRTRLIYDKPKWLGYEVVLDVFDEVIAYGVLLIPRDGKPVDHRPCVVFQHGLEGRPADTIVGDHPAYHDVSVQLVEKGYVVFAPQNLYLFQDRFRTLQRKSNPLGRTLFSIIVPQHQQIVRWLSTRPEVDAKRIGFYGLSYGGKSAMRIPALVPEYCLSICSADFNDLVWKNASTTSPYSYVWTNEYEIFEFGLGRSFNYAEMAALIAPRPFMVERGHFDGVAPDERVALEFAKVNRLYSTILKSPKDCEIEWFDGPHTINGKGTFDFLARHLKDGPSVSDQSIPKK